MERTAVRGRLTWQTAAVTSVTRETASVVTIELDAPDWPGHRAGQHLEIRLTAEDDYQAEREYSIASAPGEPAGDELELRGPIGGYFVWEAADGGPLMYTLTREQPSGWTGHVGRISKAMLAESAWPADANPLAYICGPTSFVETAAAGLASLSRPGPALYGRRD